MPQEKDKNPKGEEVAKDDEIPEDELDEVAGGDGQWGSALTFRPVPKTDTFGGDDWGKK